MHEIINIGVISYIKTVHITNTVATVMSHLLSLNVYFECANAAIL